MREAVPTNNARRMMSRQMRILVQLSPGRLLRCGCGWMMQHNRTTAVPELRPDRPPRYEIRAFSICVSPIATIKSKLSYIRLTIRDIFNIKEAL